MARPVCEPRAVLKTALAALPDGATWRAMAERTGLPASLTRRTLDNMARAGDAVRAGATHVPGVNRPATVYKLATAERQAGNDLAMAMRGWVNNF